MIWRVGMRCKLVRRADGSPSQHYGEIGTVMSVFGQCERVVNAVGVGVILAMVNCEVRWDSAENQGNCPALQHTDQLEPLRRDDNEVGSWAELGFHPSQFIGEPA